MRILHLGSERWAAYREAGIALLAADATARASDLFVRADCLVDDTATAVAAVA